MSAKSNKIGFLLRQVITEQFAIIESSFENEKPVSVNVDLRFSINNKNKIIVTIVSINLLQEETPFLILEVGCYFSITQDAWDKFLDADNSKIVIPKDFLGHLAMLTIGTTRGVLHSKTENTPFDKFLLPTINVNELVKEDSIFEIDIESE